MPHVAFPKACLFSRVQSSCSQKQMCYPDNRVTPHLKLLWNCKMKSTFCKQPSAIYIIASTDSWISWFPQQRWLLVQPLLLNILFFSSVLLLTAPFSFSMEVLSPPSFLCRRCFVSVCIPTLKFILLLFPIITNFLFHWWRSVQHNMELIHFENKLLACSFLFIWRSLTFFLMHPGLT